jgi:hypothetical protein
MLLMLHRFMWRSSYPQRSPPYSGMANPDIGRGVLEISWIADNAQDRHTYVWLVTKYTNDIFSLYLLECVLGTSWTKW